MKHIKLFENYTRDEQDRLKDLGLGYFDWRAELEIDYGQASQNTSATIQSILIDRLPQINAISPDFQIAEDSIGIDEWEEADFLTQNTDLPDQDEIAGMRKSQLLNLIEEFDLDVDYDEAAQARLGELKELVIQAIEDSSEIDYSPRNAIRFTVRTKSNSEQEVTDWIESNVVEDRVFTDIIDLEKID